MNTGLPTNINCVLNEVCEFPIPIAGTNLSRLRFEIKFEIQLVNGIYMCTCTLTIYTLLIFEYKYNVELLKYLNRYPNSAYPFIAANL